MDVPTRNSYRVELIKSSISPPESEDECLLVGEERSVGLLVQQLCPLHHRFIIQTDVLEGGGEAGMLMGCGGEAGMLMGCGGEDGVWW